jgi:hypothetical protein
MLGQSTHIRRVDDHGGFGRNPIYRVTVRNESSRRDMRYARIRAIPDGGVALCADLTTDRGKFWLPESDVLVHNCDDQAVLNATLLSLNGIPARFRITAPRSKGRFHGDPGWAHIYAMGALPKNNPSSWIALDTTIPGNFFSKEAPYGRAIDFIA